MCFLGHYFIYCFVLKETIDLIVLFYLMLKMNYRFSCRLPSPEFLRSEGRCPLTPEEAVLTIAALGFNRETHIYLAGSHIYGGNSRMAALTRLYPNLVTKENLLSPSEIGPFMNFSSQVIITASFIFIQFHLHRIFYTCKF